jgi:hypothetical protein
MQLEELKIYQLSMDIAEKVHEVMKQILYYP